MQMDDTESAREFHIELTRDSVVEFLHSRVESRACRTIME